MYKKKNIVKKTFISIICVIVMVFSMPVKAKADVIQDLVNVLLRIPDAIMWVSNRYLADRESDEMHINIGLKGVHGVKEDDGAVYNFFITPYDIFTCGEVREYKDTNGNDRNFRNLPIFYANFFNIYEDTAENDPISVKSNEILRPVIGNIYKYLRKLSLVLMMLVLLYIGIRIMLSVSSAEQAKYKNMLIDWGVGISLLFIMHYIMSFIMNIKIKSPCLKEKYTNICLKHNSFIEEIAVAISAQFMTMPIIITKYNFISLSFIVTNILVGIIIGPLVIGGIIQILVTFLSLKIGTEIAKVVQIPITALSLISKIGTKFPITNFNVITPDTWQIIIYYFIIYIIYYRHKIKKIQKYSFNQKIILKISKYVYSKRKIIIRVFIIILISSIIIKKIPGDLKIYFVDVGQGDCCLIETPKHQKILIDGGGQKNFDIGKNTLLPYLFNRKILEIDYCIISHFDQDHCGGILYILEQIKVKNVIIGKQYEDSTNYNKFKEIVKKQNLNVKIVEAGMRINIEKNLYFDVLWPDSQKMISDNAINNNSLVCKLNYNKFSMLFTGDIEEIAEKEIVSKYENNTSILKSTILKTAHHGSKTSSIEKILDVVKPQYAFIGVGENNTFGHPSNITIENLEKRKIKIYRTDKMGEICIKITKKAIIKINTKLNTS